MPKPNEERELLQLQCELARLKISTSYQKQRHTTPSSPHLSHLFNAFTAVPNATWQLALLPKQKKYRLLFVGLILFTQLWMDKGKSR